MSRTQVLPKSSTVRVGTVEETSEFLDRGVADEMRRVLSEELPFWSGIEWVMDWMRVNVKQFLTSRLSYLPHIGPWASRIGATVTELCFTVLGTLVHFLKMALTTSAVWIKAHQAALLAWDANAANGLLAQGYAYGKKMAGYLLEILKQCLERSIKAHNLEVTSEESQDIKDFLDELLE
ncbi:hypothetical protein BV898_04530 [Hypsibius exemplaris]|uniref:Uncharacterized protein n=1 Tax=Hypsibius exemplaris TaxID=2072580 RepID=A0A1W0X2M7_HYPEX|nr:hypothetical protein BV898_04530 [Hypsibius exemplaris]